MYEVAGARHDHLICDECGQIVEFTDDDIGALLSDIAARHGFTLLRRRHELYGRCRACREST